MSKRTQITKALADKFKDISIANGYLVDLQNNAHNKLKFWDEISDFPAVYVVAGPEYREYLPGAFTWVHFDVSIKAYCRGDESQDELQNLLDDIERVLDENNNLQYDPRPERKVVEMRITRIVTDEGLLDPFAIGDVGVRISYQVFTG